MSEWKYGVTYEKKHGLIKDKHFNTEEEARVFYDKHVKYERGAIIFRFKAPSLIDRILEAKITWLGFEINLIFLSMGFLLGYVVTQTIWDKIP